MREMEYKCDKDILEGEERPGEKQVVVASVLHLFVSLIVLVKAGCLFFSFKNNSSPAAGEKAS